VARPRRKLSSLLVWSAALGLGCGADAGAPAEEPPDVQIGARASALVAPLPGAMRSTQVGGGFGQEDGGVPTDPRDFDPIAAQATLVVTTEGVDVSMQVTGCAPFIKGYTVRVHSAASCEDLDAQGNGLGAEESDGVRLWCNGTSGLGALFHEHPHTRLPAWTVGGPAESDLVGRVLVIHDPNTDAPLACGPIVAVSEPDAGAHFEASVEQTTLLTGHCLLRQGVTATAACPDAQEMAECAALHCELQSCANLCADQLSCAARQPDVCAATDCEASVACHECTGELLQCIFGFCPETLRCAELAPDGPCAELRECCHTQGDFEEQCLMLVELQATVGGDPSCLGAMSDWDWNVHLPVPCDYGEPE